MKREILFKGKRKDNGKWIEGSYAEHNGKVFIVTWVRCAPDTRDWDAADYCENNPHYSPSLIEVIPETVCQYTGLKDRQKRKIFEQDILNIPYSNKKGLPGVAYYDLSDAAFCMGRNGYRSISLANADTWCEVLGNIHDVPETPRGPIMKKLEKCPLCGGEAELHTLK